MILLQWSMYKFSIGYIYRNAVCLVQAVISEDKFHSVTFKTVSLFGIAS